MSEERSSHMTRSAESHDSGSRQTGPHKSLWSTVRDVVVSQGLELFDMDLPGDAGGALRVYITKPRAIQEGSDTGASERRAGVSFEDCVRVSKILLDLDEESSLIPEGCLLEVSSPGINRRLRRPEHFAGAVGERVKVKYRDPESESTQVVIATVEGCDGSVLKLQVQTKGESVVVPLENIKEAKVDFQF